MSGALRETVRVNLDLDGYDILIGQGLLAGAGTTFRHLLGDRLNGCRLIPITDSDVAPLHLSPLETALDAAGLIRAPSVIIPSGESAKSIPVLGQLLDSILAGGCDRRSVILALGGGVTGDLAGFAASIVLRGVGLIQIPTTLLAQVDSAVGGKTGINAAVGKNLIGSFHQPLAVLADTQTLSTLPLRQLRAGYAEVVKHALLGDAPFFDWLEQGGGAQVLDRNAEALARVIAHSCRMKAGIVSRDERETGERALLNLGHTFAHAFEAAAGYDGRVLHGEAVAVGLVCAFRLSARLGLAPLSDAHRIARHLTESGLPTEWTHLDLNTDVGALLAHMRHDKKAASGRLVFILTRGIGQAHIAPSVPETEVASVLNAAPLTITNP